MHNDEIRSDSEYEDYMSDVGNVKVIRTEINCFIP